MARKTPHPLSAEEAVLKYGERVGERVGIDISGNRLYSPNTGLGFRADASWKR